MRFPLTFYLCLVCLLPFFLSPAAALSFWKRQSLGSSRPVSRWRVYGAGSATTSTTWFPQANGENLWQITTGL